MRHLKKWRKYFLIKYEAYDCLSNAEKRRTYD